MIGRTTPAATAASAAGAWVLDIPAAPGGPDRVTAHDVADRSEPESRAHFLHLLADGAQDILYRYRVRPEPAFEYVSPSCTRMTGYTPEEHYADPFLFLRLLHPDDLQAVESMYAGEAPDDAVLLRWIRRDGVVVWTEQRTVAERDGDGHVVAVEGVVRDVTARKRAQDRLEAMVEVTHASLEQRATDELLALIARRARDLAMASLATVVVPDAADRIRVLVAEGEGAAGLRGASFAAENSIAAEVIAGGSPVRLDDVWAPDRAPHPRRVPGAGPVLAVPLGAAGGVVGVLSITRESGAPPFSDDDVEVLTAFADQASVVLESARLRDEVQQLAVVRDRERIARDLHDGVIQSLFGVGLALQVAESEQADDRLIRARVATAMADIDRIIHDVRSYVYQLRPALLERSSLVDALQRMADDVEQRHAVVVAVEAGDEALDLLAPVAPDVVLIVREALSNVARHARALACRVGVHHEGEAVRIAVEDDGRGFDAAAVPPGRGLDNLAARARELGGWLLVHSSADGGGSTVEVLLPVAALQARAGAPSQASA